VGLNIFTASVFDGKGGSDTASLQIVVSSSLAAPTNLVATSTVSRRIDLTWTDNSTGESGFKIERSINGTNFVQIAIVRANVKSFSNLRLLPGRTYYYRVRAYYRTTNSSYTNTASAAAQ
jgi:hypothetical protein